MYPYLVVVVFAVGHDAFPDSGYWFPPRTIFSKQPSSFSSQIIARASCFWTLMVAFGQGRLEFEGEGFQLFAIASVFDRAFGLGIDCLHLNQRRIHNVADSKMYLVELRIAF